MERGLEQRTCAALEEQAGSIYNETTTMRDFSGRRVPGPLGRDDPRREGMEEGGLQTAGLASPTSST